MSRPLDPLLGRLPIRTASAAFAVALLLPAGAVAQAPDTAVAAPGGAAQTDAPDSGFDLETRMVDVDGHAMRVSTVGLDARGPDRPVVVFENGATAPLESWGTVPARVAAFAPVVVYDRSTLGKSEWDGELGTPEHVTDRLWALLRAVGAEPPYVLVGWSWGGDLIRHHAGARPDDVAGLVHVDPAGHSPAAALEVLRAIGLGEETYAADAEAMEGALPTISPALQADVKPINRLYADRVEPDYGPVPPVPTVVLLSGKRRPPPPEAIEAFGEPNYDLQVHYAAKLREKIGRLGEWTLAAPEGLLVVARESHHAIQLEEPDLVVDAIRRVVDGGGEDAGHDEVGEGDAIVEEARAFMEGYATDLLGGEPDAISARYSRRGAYLVLPGTRSLVPHEEIVRRYGEGGPASDAFAWQDLAFEPVGEDAVMVVGAFRWESAGRDGVLGTYTSLLVREEGELRIRLENESFDNLPPAECEGRAEPCDLPLEEAALARYVGEYETQGEEGLTRVYVDDGRLVAQRAGGPPTPLLHEGGHAFRIAAAPSVRIVFDGGGERATSYVAFTGTVHTRATRIP